jgi:tight adherence protein C
LTGIIEQNIRRGTNAMSIVLKNELNTAMLEKKHVMLKEGGQISTKLMGPMIIMLVVAMAIIMVPAFLSMNV